MERFDLLTGDPLRLGGAGRAASALRRLEAASSRVGPLENAGRGLAALTRVRLGGLTSPPRGDEALAAVLARCVATAAVDVEPETHARRLLARPPAVGRFDAAAAASPDRSERSSVRLDRPHEPAARSVRSPEPAPAALRRREPPPVHDARRRLLDRLGVEQSVPVPPAGFEKAEGALGLEWLVFRMPGGAEASQTPLVEGAPEGRRSPPASDLATSASAARAMPAQQEQTPASSTLHEVERAVETRRPAVPVAPASQRVVLPTGAPGLEALVRAWEGAEHTPAEHTPPEPIELPAQPTPGSANGSSARIRTISTSRERPEALASEREDEMLAFGDTLGRILVAELRRYGIEVDAG